MTKVFIGPYPLAPRFYTVEISVVQDTLGPYSQHLLEQKHGFPFFLVLLTKI